jgi:hypothetical protein
MNDRFFTKFEQPNSLNPPISEEQHDPAWPAIRHFNPRFIMMAARQFG